MNYEEKLKEALNSGTTNNEVVRWIECNFPELKESEDEKLRKEILAVINDLVLPDEQKSRFIAWLEKQGEHIKFLNSIQVGDQVTRNEDGELFNLSQLKRVAKPAENKGKSNMGISEATKQKLEDNLNKALEKETSESLGEFLNEQGEQKSAWSEEDDEMLDSIIEEVRYIGDFPDYPTKEENELYDECLAKVEWLKSLKDRYTWKPSDEQMDVLVWCQPLFVDPKLKGILDSLIKDLKKLKGE